MMTFCPPIMFDSDSNYKIEVLSKIIEDGVLICIEPNIILKFQNLIFDGWRQEGALFRQIWRFEDKTPLNKILLLQHWILII